MFGMSFMQLGLMSTIANAVGKAISKVVGVIVAPILKILAEILLKSLIIPFLQIILKSGLINTLVSLLINLVLELSDTLFELLGWKDALIDGVIKAADGIFYAISTGPIVDMLGWTPINFFDKGFHNHFGDQTLTTSTANPYFLSIHLMKDGIMPTAMIVFSLIILIELFQITVRTEGMRNSGFETPFKLMVKVAICKILLDNTQMVLEAIFNTGSNLFFKLHELVGEGGIYSVDDASLRNILTQPSVKWYGLVFIFLQMGIQFIFIKVVMLVVPFVLFGRVMEMYVYITLAPLPFATFASQELSQIGKNFLKNFIGISLKVVAMYIVLLTFASMMLFLIFGHAGDVSSAITAIVSTMFSKGVLFWVGVGKLALEGGVKPLIFAIMLLMSIMGTDKYVKSITGAFY